MQLASAAGRVHGRVSGQQQSQERLAREQYRCMQGDAVFYLACEVEGAAAERRLSEGTAADDGLREVCIAGRSELWSAIQVTKGIWAQQGGKALQDQVLLDGEPRQLLPTAAHRWRGERLLGYCLRDPSNRTCSTL